MYIVKWAGEKGSYINDWYGGGKSSQVWVKHRRDAKLFESVRDAEKEINAHRSDWKFQVLFMHPLNVRCT